jgi:hypothetical protein
MSLATLVQLTQAAKTAVTRSTNANLLIDIGSLTALDPVQLKACLVYYAIQAAYSELGTSVDYRSDLPGLRQNTATYFGNSIPVGVPGKQFLCGQVAIGYNEALNATVNGNANTVIANIETLLRTAPVLHLSRYPEPELDRFWLYLRYQLSTKLVA